MATAWFAAWALFGGCDGIHPVPNSIRGIQVIAIETTPAQPEPLEALTIDVWVADGLGRGADVLVWLCTPYEGRCVEAYPPGSTGLPLSVWTRVGNGAPQFETVSSWPLFADIADANFELTEDLRGKLLVWALACAPGLCPIIDEVAVNPRSASEAYEIAAAKLADPASWLDELPRGQVSVAVKAVPVALDSSEDETPYSYGGYGPYTEPPINHAPSITLTDSSLDNDAVRGFVIDDPDGDSLVSRAFTTAGGVYLDTSSAGTLTSGTHVWLQWQEPVVQDREGDVFLVVEDQRGGTSVWTSNPGFDPCQGAPTVGLSGVGPGGPVFVDDENAATYLVEIPWDVRGPGPNVEVNVDVGGPIGRSESVNTGLGPACHAVGRFNVRFNAGLADVCGLLGTLTPVTVRMTDLETREVTSSTTEVVLRASQSLGNACLAL